MNAPEQMLPAAHQVGGSIGRDPFAINDPSGVFPPGHYPRFLGVTTLVK